MKKSVQMYVESYASYSVCRNLLQTMDIDDNVTNLLVYYSTQDTRLLHHLEKLIDLSRIEINTCTRSIVKATTTAIREQIKLRNVRFSVVGERTVSVRSKRYPRRHFSSTRKSFYIFATWSRRGHDNGAGNDS